jgi:hypothetical protein
MVKIRFLFPVLLLYAAFACKEPGANVNGITNSGASTTVMFYTSLADTLPGKTLQRMNVGDVNGVKFKSLNGNEVRYFEYNADPRKLLAAISEMPFNKNASIADTLCRQIDLNDLSLAAQDNWIEEDRYRTQFTEANRNNFLLYECIKPPLIHTLLIAKNSNNVIHRIAYLN